MKINETDFFAEEVSLHEKSDDENTEDIVALLNDTKSNSDTVEITKPKTSQNRHGKTLPNKASIKYPDKKIGPQKQKRTIHTLLKKARVYEIRKITRRIDMLRNMKGSEEEKTKNLRKVEKLLMELQEIKAFIIEKLVERTVSIFKGKIENSYLEYWNCCQEPKKLGDLLQRLSVSDNENKFSDIAYVKLISSKDIIEKLKLISNGVNINPKKPKKKSKKNIRKKRIGKDKVKVNDTDISEKDEKTRFIENEEEIAKKSKAASQNMDGIKTFDHEKESDIKTKIVDSQKDGGLDTKIKKSVNTKANPEKEKNIKDPFFLDQEVQDSDDDDNDLSPDEFDAPVKRMETEVLQKKKNRMGQRQRKKIAESSNARGRNNRNKFNRQTNMPKRNNSNLSRKPRTHSLGGRIQDDKGKKFKKNPQSSIIKKKTIDENLHPSWVAKQKIKVNQGITQFSGTKITFDD